MAVIKKIMDVGMVGLNDIALELQNKLLFFLRYISSLNVDAIKCSMVCSLWLKYVFEHSKAVLYQTCII